MVRFYDDEPNAPEYTPPVDDDPNFKWHGETPEEVQERLIEQRKNAHGQQLSAQASATPDTQKQQQQPAQGPSNGASPVYQQLQAAQLQQAQQQQDKLSPEQQTAWMNMVLNPSAFQQYLSQFFAGELEQQNVANEYRQKHPELCDYEPLIAHHVRHETNKAAMGGQLLSMREAMEAGIQAFLDKYPKLAQDINTDDISTTTNKRNASSQGREVMRLDVKGAAASSQKSKKATKPVWEMTPAEFDKYDDDMMRSMNQYY